MPWTPSSSLLMRALSDSVGRVDDEEEFSTRILDAAGGLFGRRGIQRVTMEEVAKAAGVARVTIYRRFATKDVLIEHVVRREFRRYFDQFLRDIKQGRTAADRVVVGFVSSLRAIRGNSLIGGLLAAEPDLLVPSLVGDEGRTLGTVREFIAGPLRREQAAGTVADRPGRRPRGRDDGPHLDVVPGHAESAWSTSTTTSRWPRSRGGSSCR